MANYAKSWQTQINVLQLAANHNLSQHQIDVLSRYNGLDLSYENCNHCRTLNEFADAMNAISMPAMELEYSVIDEFDNQTYIAFVGGKYRLVCEL